MTKKPKLLPCPFCGHEFTQKEVNDQYDCAFVECSHCDAQGPYILIDYDNPLEAINAWNTRSKKKDKNVTLIGKEWKTKE